MAKRRATSQLNKDDPDESDGEVEESGEFQRADSDEMSKRVIKTAKRRMTDTKSASPFANFIGFSSAPSASSLPTATKPDTKPNAAPDTTTATSSTNNNDNRNINSEALKSLNMCCLKWISDHLDKNPYVILSPVFGDYEKHLNSILADKMCQSKSDPSVEKKTNATSVSSSSTNTNVSKSQFTFGPAKEPENDRKPSAASTSNPKPFFSFGISKDSESSSNISTISPATSTTSTFAAFCSTTPSSTTTPLGGLSFGSNFNNGGSITSADKGLFSGLKSGTAPSAGFSFGQNSVALATPSEGERQSSNSSEQKPNEGDPSDETPDFDFVPVAETGSVFDIRCKVFLKKNESFASIGVGTLYLKPVSGEKTQLIVRADTAQGSVLLNLILTKDLPLQRTGKNNVLIVCIPTPDAKPPPIPVLIRVKSSEERDKLLSEMEKLRGQ